MTTKNEALKVINKFRREYACGPNEILFMVRLWELGLTDEQIAGVIELNAVICHKCYNSEHPCYGCVEFVE